MRLRVAGRRRYPKLIHFNKLYRQGTGTAAAWGNAKAFYLRTQSCVPFAALGVDTIRTAPSRRHPVGDSNLSEKGKGFHRDPRRTRNA